MTEKDRPSWMADTELESSSVLASSESGNDSWMISYVDMLTLLITLFVALMAMAHFGPTKEGTAEGVTEAGVPVRVHRRIAPVLLDMSTLRARTLQVARFVERQGLTKHIRVVEKGHAVIFVLHNSLVSDQQNLSLNTKGKEVISSLAFMLKGLQGNVFVDGLAAAPDKQRGERGTVYSGAMKRAAFIVDELIDRGVAPERLRIVSGVSPTGEMSWPETFVEVQVSPTTESPNPESVN